MSDQDAPSTAPRTPADFLKNIKGKSVVVKLNSGVDYKGEGLSYFVFDGCIFVLVTPIGDGIKQHDATVH